MRSKGLALVTALATAWLAPGVMAQGTASQERLTPAEIEALKPMGASAGTSGVTGIRTRALKGDASGSGLYTIQLLVPAKTRIEAHDHPDDRVATIVSGTWYFGYGEKFDESRLKALPPGSVYTEPPNVAHFARTGGTPVVLQITGVGPTGTRYIETGRAPGDSAGAASSAPSSSGASGIAERDAVVDGVKIHYLSAGSGPGLILLHGYAQTSRMWRAFLPMLSERFTVVAPDLPGIGDSQIPADGLDMKTAAIRIHALARSLGLSKARVVGHDIGLMVAYAYAAQFPGEVEKLVVMDAFLPGVGEWESVYNTPSIWHFRFNGPTPEALVQGRERTYFEFFWNDLAADRTRSIPEADRSAYAAAYARPGRMRAGWAYFQSFLKTAKDFEELSKTKLSMPVLVIGGEKSLGDVLVRQMKVVATDVTGVVLKEAGHWVSEERPDETARALKSFL